MKKKEKKPRPCDYCGQPISFIYRIDHWCPINPDDTDHECEQYRKSNSKKILCETVRQVQEISSRIGRLEEAMREIRSTRIGQSKEQKKDKDSARIRE